MQIANEQMRKDILKKPEKTFKAMCENIDDTKIADRFYTLEDYISGNRDKVNDQGFRLAYIAQSEEYNLEEDDSRMAELSLLFSTKVSRLAIYIATTLDTEKYYYLDDFDSLEDIKAQLLKDHESKQVKLEDSVVDGFFDMLIESQVFSA